MANETFEAELAAALRKRLAVISDHALRAANPERHLAQLREASDRILALQAALPANIHPQLRHYFERCSYDKALAWIEQDGLTGSTK
jgi:hypothetical protein